MAPLVDKDSPSTPLRADLELVVVLRQQLAATLANDDHVLQPDAAEVLLVDAGLDGDDIAGQQLSVLPQAHAWLLVHLDADAVAESVEEILVQRLPLPQSTLGSET